MSQTHILNARAAEQFREFHDPTARGVGADPLSPGA